MFASLFSKKDEPFNLRSFIANYKGVDSNVISTVKFYADNDNPNLIEAYYEFYRQLLMGKGSNSPLNESNNIVVFEALSEKLKENNYKVTLKDINGLIDFTIQFYESSNINPLITSLHNNNLIDEAFIDNLAIYALKKRDYVYDLNRCLMLLKGFNDYLDKFRSKLREKLFTGKNIAETLLKMKSPFIKTLKKENIITDYYPELVAYNKEYLLNKTKVVFNDIFFSSLSILDEYTESKPFLKDIIDSFQPKNNEEVLDIFFFKLIGTVVITKPITYHIEEGKHLEYLMPALVNIYSITYADIISFLKAHRGISSDMSMMLFLSGLLVGIIPTKEEIETITKEYYKDFLNQVFKKNSFEYDPELYTLYIKVNQGKINHNDEKYKKWIQDWYIPHSKLKDDDFFTFSEQEQACYLNEPEKFKVENTSLGIVSVDVLKYNINHIDGREFGYIYKYKDKQGNSPQIQDIITRRKETIDIDLKFTNSEIIDYHPELRIIEAYKRYMEKQALFISSLSLYEYGIVFSHFTGMFQYSTNYIKNRGNVDTSLPIHSCLFELIIGVCLENGIDIGFGDLQEGMTLEEIFYIKLSGKKDSLDKTEIKDLALNVSKKFMERYYIEFNKIFEKAPETEDDLVIYRGVRDVYWNNNISKGEFSALNIQSTTLIPHIPGNPYDIIQNYTDASTKKDTASCCLKRILLKKGCRSIYIQLMEAAKRPLSQVILPSYSKYIVKEVHDKLMIEELKNNQSCNVQKDFIKTFDMELIQTPSYPSVEDVVSKFSSHFKSWMYDTNSHWIVKGGFGLKKVLEIRYNKKDAIKTDDIDISVLFTKNDEDEIKAYKDKLIKEFNDFAYSTGVPYLFSYIEPRYIGEKELKWICQFSYAGREWIDISLVYSTAGKVEVDKDVSEKVGLPVKTIVGYAKDYKDILREENIKGIDDRTYKKRNPKTGFLAMKGRKDIQRTKELCFIDEVEKEFPTLCSFLKLSSVRVFMNLPEKELKALLK